MMSQKLYVQDITLHATHMIMSCRGVPWDCSLVHGVDGTIR